MTPPGAERSTPGRARPRPYSVSGVFPASSRLRVLVPLLDGVRRIELVDLPRALDAALRADVGERGRRVVDRRDPARRIAGLIERVEPERRALARRIHEGSSGRVDPRAVAGYWDVAARYRLLADDGVGVLRVTRRGRDFVEHPAGRVARAAAAREGLLHLLDEIAAGRDTLAALLPGWRAVLAGNPRFAASASWPRSLGQRVGALVADGFVVARGAHAERLRDEAGFRAREPEPAFVELDGGLALTAEGRAWRAPVA